jgi:hypothetical protein
MRRPIQILLLALAAAGAALAVSSAAAASTPCWQTLINDWYDGRIDSVYPVACYRAALEHMPEDIAQYSSLGDDINRALAFAIAHNKGGGGTGVGPGSANGSTAQGAKANSTFHGGPVASGSDVLVTASAGREGGGGPVGATLSSIGPDSADSVPVPLIVLGALAVVLLLLGSAGFIARKVQTRRATVRPSTKT